MSEFTYNPVQTVQPNQPVILNTAIPCGKGYIWHRDESGIVILRGIVNNVCGGFARYQVTFNGNIALTTGAAVAPIAVSLAVDGEPIQASRALSTPAAVGEYNNVTSTAIITVPRGCCFTVTVENDTPLTAGVSAAIDVQNANLTITRIA